MPIRRTLALSALAVAMFGAPLAAFGQTAAPPAGANAPGARAPFAAHGRHRRRPIVRALKGLALSPGQKAKIHDLMHAYRAARAAGSHETRAQLIAQIERVLTPAERATFERRLHRTRQRPPNDGSPPGPGPGENAPSQPG